MRSTRAAAPASGLIPQKAKLFRGLSDPSRLAILEALRPGPLHVGAIVQGTGLSQSNTSNHLRCLLDCGLVASEADGRFVRYRLSDPQVEVLLATAAALLAGAARGVEQCGHYAAPPATEGPA